MSDVKVVKSFHVMGNLKDNNGSIFLNIRTDDFDLFRGQWMVNIRSISCLINEQVDGLALIGCNLSKSTNYSNASGDRLDYTPLQQVLIKGKRSGRSVLLDNSSVFVPITHPNLNIEISFKEPFTRKNFTVNCDVSVILQVFRAY